MMNSSGYSRLYAVEPTRSAKVPSTAYYYKKISIHTALHILLFASNLCFLLLWLKGSQEDCVRPKLVFSPAEKVIQYEKKRLMRSIKDNVYTGQPRPEHDDAWRHLIEPMTIKVSREELAHINETSIEFRDGSGFIAETAVYHELHCVKRIRRHLNLDYYYPNMTDDERRREGPHIDHCLEYWREAAMCRGDMTLSAFRWADGIPYSTVYSDHECVNWEALDRWARRRMVDMGDMSALRPEGQEDESELNDV